MRTAVLLALLPVLAFTTSVLYVYHPSHFNETARCVSCRPTHVCIVQATQSSCMDRVLAMKQIGTLTFVEYGSEEEKVARKVKDLAAPDHRRRGHLGERDCSAADLLGISTRLLLWAASAHASYAGVDVSMPSHSIACLPASAWMFAQLDGDADGLLTPTELLTLLEGPPERCLAQFIDHCDDITADGVISMDEWCDCFHSADDREEPACHKHKHAVDPHVKDVFVPHCDIEGFYAPAQCHQGSCWCSDKYGREMDGSRVAKKLPDCRQYAVTLSDVEMSELQARL